MKALQYLSYICICLVCVMPCQAHAHCEIPCGVYNDGMRFDWMEEHARTIEKAMTAIGRATANNPEALHTIARWTEAKEEHAQKIQNIAAQYFLTQRVKRPAEADDRNYIRHTTLLHAVLVAAMNTKQSIDTDRVEVLRQAIQDYKTHYFAPHGHAH